MGFFFNQKVLIFLFLHENVHCGYSLEVPWPFPMRTKPVTVSKNFLSDIFNEYYPNALVMEIL